MMIDDILNFVKEAASSEGFYAFYSNRKELVERLNRALKRSPVSSATVGKLRKRKAGLAHLSYEEIEFSIDILRERDRAPEERVEYASTLFKVSVSDMGHLLFFVDPRNNPPVTGPVKERIQSIDDYKEWQSLTRSVGEHGIQDFVMLEAALLFEREENNRSSNLSERLIRAVYTDISEIKTLRNAVTSLSKSEKRLLSNLRFTHPYVKTAIMSNHSKPVVIDGSNIVFSMTEHADLKRIDDLFLRMALCRIALFPYRIVFDANIRYTIGGFQQESLNRLLSLPQVETYSPADDRLIFLAREGGSAVITYDRFLDHAAEDITIIRPEEIDESLRL